MDDQLGGFGRSLGTASAWGAAVVTITSTIVGCGKG
jgi:hypothetical protein